MKNFGLNELREMFLAFFETKGHLRLPSFSLIPQNDASLLLINSGMAPMKPYFTGEQEPPRHRVCTCQKCIRTGDIENIGKTARHGTYFEMLGNFSFGDYFKHEAIAWSWEFLTSPDWVGLDPERLYPSIYVDDDEAFEIWNKEIGIPAERIFRFGKEDNFWEHGSGPCGPCSEIYYDRGEQYGCGKPDCTVGCDCDRYMEVWNNVFSQFNNDGNGNYTELAQKNIDTGMGLERLAVVCQGVASLFDVDTVMNITNKVSQITGAHYGDSDKVDVSLRIITDHIRASVMMICDGVLPSNEGRGYVLRRLLRRAARHGKLLGVNDPFLYEVCDTVIHENEGHYPELREKLGDHLSSDTSLNREDSFLRNYKHSHAKGYKTQKAYLLRGERLRKGEFGVMHGYMNIPQLKKVCHSYGVSINEYLVSAFVWSVFLECMHGIPGRRPIRVAVPVNLRPYFNSVTTKNFFTMVSAEFGPVKEDYTFAEVVEIVKDSLRSQITKEHLEELFSYNVSNEKLLIARAVPLVLKNLAIRYVYTSAALANTSTVTNIGNQVILEEYQPYVKMFYAFLAMSKGQNLKGTICSYQDTLVFSFSSVLRDTSVQRGFFRRLAEDGIDVEIESNGVYYE